MRIFIIFLLFFTFAFSKCDNSLLGGTTLECGISIIITDPHIAPCCESIKHKFDAVDVGKEENITTKILGDFDVTIKTDQNFSGTVYAVVQENDINISDVNITSWDDEKEKNITLKNITKVSKKAYIYIKWDDNTSNDDDGEANSSDDFAIRPDKFIVEIPSNIIAAKEFNITIKALDKNGNAAKDYNESVYVRGDSVDLEYNETKKDCKTGELNITDGGEFKDGVANVSLKYSEIGDVDISILEKSGSEFASVDSDDTDDDKRLITSASKTISVGADHFEISADFKNYNNENNFTYYDDTLTIHSFLELNITAKNEDNKTLENYNKDCYAKDLNIKILHNNIDVNVTKILYKYIDTQNNANEKNISKDEDITFTYSKDNFTTDNNGSTRVEVYLNFDRNLSNPINPLDFVLSKIDVDDEDTNGSLAFNKNARYYYGNLLLDDITLSSNNLDVSFDFVIYNNNTNLNPKNSKEALFNWWINPLHNANDGNVTKDDIKITSDFNANSQEVDVSINSVEVKNGKLNISLTRNSTKIKFAVVHLLSENLKWLWYSRYNQKYDISDDSSCLEHFCFSITWQDIKEKGDIGSGEYKGVEVNLTDTNTTKRGPKMFR